MVLWCRYKSRAQPSLPAFDYKPFYRSAIAIFLVMPTNSLDLCLVSPFNSAAVGLC